MCERVNVCMCFVTIMRGREQGRGRICVCECVYVCVRVCVVCCVRE